MSASIFFIVNPAAQNGKAVATWAAVQEYMDARGQKYEYALSADLEDVERLARTAAKPGTIIAGVGGDGTLSRIAGALAGTKAVLSVIPAGTGNDFARTMGIPLSPTAACDVLLTGVTVPLDLGMYNGIYFYNAIGAGLDAEVAAEANRTFKRFSSIAYILALLKQLAIYRPQPVTIEVDGKIVSGPVWLVTVANARYYGGGMKIAPLANPQDGFADIVVVGNVHRLNFLRLFPLVYSGRHVGHPAVQVFRGKEIRIDSVNKLSVHADGDLAGTTPVVIKMCHHAALLRVPNKTSFDCLE